MNFIVLILLLWVEKFSAVRMRVQRDDFYLQRLARLEQRAPLVGHPWWVLSVWVLLPVALLVILLMVLAPVAYGLLALPVHLLVMIWSLGRGDVRAAMGPLRDAWRRNDPQAAELVAERDLGLGADSNEQLLARVERELLWHGYQGFFAVIFWYSLLGPAAALAYRLLALASEKSGQPGVAERAAQLRHAFDWVPVRLLALSFALVGNFVAVSRALLHELLSWELSAASLIARAGQAADDVSHSAQGVDPVASLDRMWELLLRSAILWYAGMALWTLLV